MYILRCIKAWSRRSKINSNQPCCQIPFSLAKKIELIPTTSLLMEEGVCKIYEEYLKRRNPNTPTITYDINFLTSSIRSPTSVYLFTKSPPR